MGQQQLLLLVLGVVIVGLAVVVGIQAFGENQKSANQDALVNDAIRIASDLQAQALKPTQFGGAGTFDDLTVTGDDANADWAALGYETGGSGCADTEYGNLNGCFALSITGEVVSITGKSTDADGNALNDITVEVSGAQPENISTTINGS